jgi:hypothetical protein
MQSPDNKRPNTYPTRRTFLTLVGATGLTATAGCLGGQETEEPVGDPGEQISLAEDAKISFEQPQDGQTIADGVSVIVNAENVELEPAGQARDGAGHLIILVDTDPIQKGDVVPQSDSIVHLGAGEGPDLRMTVLDLEPGEHTLTAQLADGVHRATDLTSETVTVTVTGDASASFVDMEDGTEVTSPVTFRWTTENYEIEPAGQVRQNAGHGHLLIDQDPVEVGTLIPVTENSIHYGGGETEATLDLEPGEHRVVLQMGNGNHYATPLVDEVTITVTE